jgi:ArsR family transcriptional regulator, arsenate/arsenite/antimonite-responsive transcriptional repressor
MAFHKKEEFGVKEQSLAFAKAVSYPARIAILNVLAKKNESICNQLVEVLPLAHSTVSQHLKEQNAGLITGEVDGTQKLLLHQLEGFSEV